MIITCEACNTSFNLDEKMLKPEGSKVRCSVCATVFTAYPKQVSSSEPVGDTEPPVPVPDEPEIPLEPRRGDQTKAEDEMLSHDSEDDFSLKEESVVETLETGIEETIDKIEEEKEADQEVLDTELDLFFDTDIPDESDATVIADLDDDEFDLSLDLQPEEGDLDLSDLDESDLDLDAPFVSEDDPESTETIIADLDDSVDLEDNLDLSGLEKMLQEDDTIEDDNKTMVADDGDADLSLDLEENFSIADGDKDGDEGQLPGDSLDELELDLEADDVVDDGGADSGDQEIDLSEIEKMLEEPVGEITESSTVPEQDLDLDVEAGLDAEKWMAKPGEDDRLVQDEEIDLTELEQVLEDVDLDAEQQPAEEPELVLDLEDQDVGEASSGTTDDLELDFSGFEDNIQFLDDETGGTSEPDDIELEFEVETDRKAEQTLEDQALAKTDAVADPKPESSEVPPPPPETVKEPETLPVSEPVEKGTNKFLVFFLIIVFLGGGAFGTYYLLNQQGINIPFISDFLKPTVDDPGNLKLSTYEINSKFVDNTNVGKLFVISGKVKNGYPENRGMIAVQGKLFSEGKVPVNQEKVYCGNFMSDLELANLEWEKIKARLSNRLGDNRSNVKIAPGQSIPFMVVFSGLPDDLEEFTIEVTGSTVLK